MSTTAKKAAVKRPTDRQVKKNEANPDEARDMDFEWGGHAYTIPADAFDDVEIVELLEDEKHISVVRQILGDEQWKAWKDRARVNGRVPASALGEFLGELFEVAGQGNSPASSTS